MQQNLPHKRNNIIKLNTENGKRNKKTKTNNEEDKEEEQKMSTINFCIQQNRLTQNDK